MPAPARKPRGGACGPSSQPLPFQRWPKRLTLAQQGELIELRRARLEQWCDRFILGLTWLENGGGLVAESLCLACDHIGAYIDVGPLPGEVRCRACGLRMDLPDYARRFGWPAPRGAQ